MKRNGMTKGHAVSGRIWPAACQAAWVRRCGLALTAIVATLLLVTPGPAVAQQTGAPLGGGFVTPFPENNTYRIDVFGDSLAQGLAQGLTSALSDDSEVVVIDKSNESLGLTRNDGQTWDKIAGDLAAGEPFHIAVLLFGAEDRNEIKIDKRYYEPGSAEWRSEYGKRTDLLIKALKKKGVAVYVMGLPIMRSQRASADAEMMNTIFREKALINGSRYVETWNGFVDASNEFTDYGPDMQGKVKQLRAGDGVHFTPKGYEKLAHFIEREIRRDLAIARSSRDVPLAGDEDEQAQIEAAAKPEANGQKSATAATRGGTVQAAATAAQSSLPDYAAADSEITIATITNGKAGETKLEIARPAIPGSVVAHLLRTSAARAPEIGQTLTADLKGGLTALSSVALGTAGGGSASGGQVPVTQSPYYRVLVKGDQLQPKPNRADDFSWPRAGTAEPAPSG